MHHYFIENKDLENVQAKVFDVCFNELDKNHLLAQRLHAGEHITVVDRSANYFELEIVGAKNARISAKIATKKNFPRSKFHTTLYQGVSKNTKLEDVLRAATEIGIDEFCAVNMQRSVAVIKDSAKSKKLERFMAIARSAAMQSGRSDIPKVTIAKDSQIFLNCLKTLDLLLVFWEKSSSDETVEKALSNLDGVRNLGIVVGPEGGISDAEIHQLKSTGKCKICTLGNTILRTETAGIVATGIVKHVLESR